MKQYKFLGRADFGGSVGKGKQAQLHVYILSTSNPFIFLHCRPIRTSDCHADLLAEKFI
jgi:hypothetical protein